MQSRGFLGRLPHSLLKAGLLSMRNVIQTLTKSVLIPSALIGAASARDAKMHRKNIRIGIYNTNNI